MVSTVTPSISAARPIRILLSGCSISRNDRPKRVKYPAIWSRVIPGQGSETSASLAHEDRVALLVLVVTADDECLADPPANRGHRSGEVVGKGDEVEGQLRRVAGGAPSRAVSGLKRIRAVELERQPTRPSRQLTHERARHTCPPLRGSRIRPRASGSFARNSEAVGCCLTSSSTMSMSCSSAMNRRFIPCYRHAISRDRPG